MPRRVIDLSQPLSRSTQVHPFFNPPQIVRELIHADYAPDQPSFNAELIITSNHAATHVDAFGHYDRACAEHGITHYENLNNLAEVAGRRLEFYGSRSGSRSRTDHPYLRSESWKTWSAMTTVKDMVADAKTRIENLSMEDVEAERNESDVLLIDVRDVRELWREGKIPGARHVPRGMLEFWADPESEYHKDFMQPEARVILYCAGGLRSALAADALGHLGYTDVGHLEIGFDEWKRRGGEVDEVPQKR